MMSLITQLQTSIYSKKYGDSIRHLNAFFDLMNNGYGGLTKDFSKELHNFGYKGKGYEHVANILASSITTLLTDSEFNLPHDVFYRLLLNHRNIAIIFGATPFKNGDHILKFLNFEKYSQGDKNTDLNILYKGSLVYTIDSSFPFNFNEIAKLDLRLALSLALSLLSSQVIIGKRASYNREILLLWLSEALNTVSHIEALPLRRMHDVYMNCSYADFQAKHDIKKQINRLIKLHINRVGLYDRLQNTSQAEKKDKPVIFIILEWFTQNHSIFRTHSQSIVSLKESYKVIGIGYSGFTDDFSRKIFDEFYELPEFNLDLNFIKSAYKLAEIHNPCAVYYPSLGMSLHTIYLSNIRLAKTQIIAMGHPATTHSNVIDYVLVEEDYVGDVNCFSEKVTLLSKDSLPYLPPNTDAYEILNKDLSFKRNRPVHIVVALAIMKINHNFLRVCRRIADEADVEVVFHFMAGGARGFIYSYVKNLIFEEIPDANIYPQLPYKDYFKKISECDLFINPFPFGNTNGLVDTVKAFLPGVCFTGPEVHSHIDEGLFKRLNLPAWTITKTEDDYVRATLKLVNDEKLRESLSLEIKKNNPDTILFKGNSKKFHDTFHEIINQD